MGKLPFELEQQGSQGVIKTDDACEHIRFSNRETAIAQATGKTNARTGSPEVWDLIQKNCTTEVLTSPIADDKFKAAPQETDPGPGGDTAANQGQITPPPVNTVKQDEQKDNPPITEEPKRPPNGDKHPTHSAEKPDKQTNAGEPVDIFNGTYYLQETDLVIPNSILPLAFVRFYRSGATSFGPFGWNWDHNFNLFLRELSNGDIAIWRNLHEEIFSFDGAGYEPQRGVFEMLERVPALAQVYEIKAEGGLIMHFERPAGWIDGERIPLLLIRDRHGNQLQFSYGADDKLAEVRDDDDRYFRFNYDQCGLLVEVSDHSGRKFNYEHDEETMQLVRVTTPAITDQPGGIDRIYHYEQPWALPELRHNILRVEDSQGNVYIENTYEQDPSAWSFARLTEQLYGGFLYQFQYTQLQWVPANPLYINIPAVRAEVMNPDFGLETYTFNYRGDLLDRRYRLSKDKSFRVTVWQYEFDAQGNLSKTTRPDGSEEINVYDFANPDPRMRGKLLRREITAASGFPAASRIIWRGKYEPVYQLITEEKDETGATTTYKYDSNLTPAALTNTGKLMEVIQPDATLPDGTIQKAKTTREYNAKGQLTAEILPDSTRNEIKYGTAGNEKSRLIKQIADTGNLNVEQKIKYDTFGFNSEQTDRNGNITKQMYNALGLLEKLTFPPVNGVSSENIFHYDSDRKLISSERPRGNYTDPVITGNHLIDLFERDVLGYPVKFTLSSNSAEPRVLEVCNNYRGFPVQTINPDSSLVKKVYDERGLLLSTEMKGNDGKTISTKYVYDRTGKQTQETDIYGQTTKYEYDGFSRIANIILPNGSRIKYKWLANDLMESEETIGDDGTGAVRQLAFRSYTYDEKNRKITETVKSFTGNPAISANIKTTFFYDTRDRITKIRTHRGAVHTLQYDALDRIVKEVDALGNEERHTFDANGNLIQSDSHHIEPDTTVSVITKRFEYDTRDRRTAVIEPDGARVKYEYDDRNLLVKQTDQSGIVRETTYDSYHVKASEKL